MLRSIDRDRFVGCFREFAPIVAAMVAPASLLLGLAGAVMLTRWRSRLNGLLWWVLLSPMLAPGVVLGLSALVFWDRLGVGAGTLHHHDGADHLHLELSHADPDGAAAAPADRA